MEDGGHIFFGEDSLLKNFKDRSLPTSSVPDYHQLFGFQIVFSHDEVGLWTSLAVLTATESRWLCAGLINFELLILVYIHFFIIEENPAGIMFSIRFNRS